MTSETISSHDLSTKFHKTLIEYYTLSSPRWSSFDKVVDQVTNTVNELMEEIQRKNIVDIAKYILYKTEEYQKLIDFWIKTGPRPDVAPENQRPGNRILP